MGNAGKHMEWSYRIVFNTQSKHTLYKDVFIWRCCHSAGALMTSRSMHYREHWLFRGYQKIISKYISNRAPVKFHTILYAAVLWLTLNINHTPHPTMIPYIWPSRMFYRVSIASIWENIDHGSPLQIDIIPCDTRVLSLEEWSLRDLPWDPLLTYSS